MEAISESNTLLILWLVFLVAYIQADDNNDVKNCELYNPVDSPFAKRIINGEDAPPGRYPYMVNLVTSEKKHVCGGMLIAPNLALSAAHCSDNNKTNLYESSVQIGRYITTCEQPDHYEEFTIEQLYLHPKYLKTEEGNAIFDQMVIRFGGVSLNSPVRLPTDPIDAYNEWIFLGFGTKANWYLKWPKTLQQAPMAFVNRTECSKYKAAENNITYKEKIGDDMFCAGKSAASSLARTPSICLGDSGGPLVQIGPNGKDVAIGIASWNYACGRHNFPSIFSNISYTLDWILDTITEAEDDTPMPSMVPSEHPSVMPSVSPGPTVYDAAPRIPFSFFWLFFLSFVGIVLL